MVERWLAGDLPAAWQGAVTRVRGASVLGDAPEQALAEALTTALQLPVVWARSSASCAGVSNAYATPGRLGVDRWLALIAAYRQCLSAVLVVDIGSALTIDLVDGAGLHRGGYIMPGPRLMADALLRATDRVRFAPNEDLTVPEPGIDTATCVNNGISAALTGAVVLAHGRGQTLLGTPLTTLVAGGYAASLAQHLAGAGIGDWHLRPELVLDGLRWVLP